MPPALQTTLEGRTRLLVPSGSLGGGAPQTYPVFFNPAARVNRDVSVAVAGASRPRSYLDALCGTGARGLRVAREAGRSVHVTLVDFSVRSLAVARKNVALNGISDRCSVVHSEANRYLHSRFERADKFEAVDLDPFGTPAHYVHGALSACADGAMLSFTATDAAVLCGVYPGVALRRYGAAVPRSEFVHESALRVLLGFAARMGGIWDIGVRPVLAHSTLHYLRVFLKVSRGASHADESQGWLGYATQCNVCGTRWSSPVAMPRCASCGTRVTAAGPLWTGPLVDEGLTSAAGRLCSRRGWTDAAATLSSLSGSDSFPPFSYSIERSASRLGRSSVRVPDVMDRLAAAGFKSMKDPFEDLSVKTDAGRGELDQAVLEASRRPA